MKFYILFFCFSINLIADTSLKEFCKSTVAKAVSVQAIEGKDNWLFPFKEIQHLSKETQFSEKSVKAIIDYKSALEKEKVDLLVVPIPPKALLYQELLISNNKEWNPYKRFHEALKKQNIKSLDLVQFLYKWKKSKQVFCKRDSHFSPEISSSLASVIAENVQIPKGDQKFTLENSSISFEGDLVRQSQKEFEKETFKAEIVWKQQEFLKDNAHSPILLIGDSNCLIYSSGGDMHIRGAGVFEHLSMQLGEEIDLLGVKGSGIDTARVDFFRRSMDINYLRKKKLVIWLFASYELTESRGWKNIPIRRSR